MRRLGCTRRVFGALVLCLALGIGVLATTVRQPGDWSQDRLMLSTIVNLERLDAITARNPIPFQSSSAFETSPLLPR